MFAVGSAEVSKSTVQVRFSVLGWTAEDSMAHEAKIAELSEYVRTAHAAGLDEIEISEDLADTGLFGAVNVYPLEVPGKDKILTVIAQAADGGLFDNRRDVQTPLRRVA